MKEERLLKALGEIDEKYIAEAAEKRQKKHIGWKIGLIAASLMLVLGSMSTVLYYRALYPYPVEKLPIAETSSTTETAAVLRWDEMTDAQRYSEVEAIGNTYSSNQHQMSVEQIDMLLEEAVLTGFDEYTEQTHTVTAEVYSVDGFSMECVTAVRFDGSEEYYIYLNHLYKPDTLGQFVEDLNLKETLITGTVYYDYRKPNGEHADIRFDDLDTQKVWELLLSDLSVNNVKDYDQMWFVTKMSISIDIPALGYENISLAVTEDGYLTTNILATGKAFYIGEEKVDAFVDYVLENCSGKEIVYQTVVESDGAADQTASSEIERNTPAYFPE